jgi:hypothetical protein
MSEPRLYVDEDAGEHVVVEGLRARGVDLLTTADANPLGATDADQLAYATEQERTICPFNVAHFARLHRDNHVMAENASMGAPIECGAWSGASRFLSVNSPQMLQ